MRPTNAQLAALRKIRKFDPNSIFYSAPTVWIRKDIRRRLIKQGLINPSAGTVTIKYDTLTSAGRAALAEAEAKRGEV